MILKRLQSETKESSKWVKKNYFIEYWVERRLKTISNQSHFFKNESIIVQKEVRRVSILDVFNLFLPLILSMFQDRKKAAYFYLKMRLNLSHYFW